MLGTPRSQQFALSALLEFCFPHTLLDSLYTSGLAHEVPFIHKFIYVESLKLAGFNSLCLCSQLFFFLILFYFFQYHIKMVCVMFALGYLYI